MSGAHLKMFLAFVLAAVLVAISPDNPGSAPHDFSYYLVSWLGLSVLFALLAFTLRWRHVPVLLLLAAFLAVSGWAAGKILDWMVG